MVCITLHDIVLYCVALCCVGLYCRETGFCDGLVKSLVFVALLSGGAVNHPSRANQNFSKLREDSACDNVLLEHRLALDLQKRGLLSKIYPIMIGEFSEQTERYGGYAWPDLNGVSDVVVDSVEKKLREHLGRQSLGSSLMPKLSVKDSMDLLTKNQGYFIQGDRSATFDEAAKMIHEMVTSARSDQTKSSKSLGERHSSRRLLPMPPNPAPVGIRKSGAASPRSPRDTPIVPTVDSSRIGPCEPALPVSKKPSSKLLNPKWISAADTTISAQDLAGAQVYRSSISTRSSRDEKTDKPIEQVLEIPIGQESKLAAMEMEHNNYFETSDDWAF